MKKNLLIKLSKYFFIFLMLFSFSLNFALAIDTQTPTGGTITSDQKGIDDADDILKEVAENESVGYKPTSIEELIGKVIKAVLAFLGVLFLVLIIISGLQWMTAGGNEELIDKSKRRIKNATYGLAIVLAAYAMTMFVTTWLIEKSGFNQNLE